MLIFPAIDLIEGNAVRLYKGDYGKMTVYSTNPSEIALDFRASGAKCIHIVDLEGAKNGDTPNFDTVIRIKESSGLFCEIGGGIRSMDTVAKYIDAGIDRVILGTAAITDRTFLTKAVEQYGSKIAVGADFLDGYVAIKGWTEKSAKTADEFMKEMVDIGVNTIISTDISRDGAMQGTNRELYRHLSEEFGVNITASGGVSTIEDVKALRKMNLYGAIIGKAYYTGDISLREAVEVAEC